MDTKLPQKFASEDEHHGILKKIEIFVNVGNHCLLSIVCFYLIWYVFQDEFSELTCVHSLLCTLGFFLLTEGILIMYSRNAPTIFNQNRKFNTRIHWVFQSVGVILIVVGAIIEWAFREGAGKKHWDAKHAYWGLNSI
jgi:protein-S-isoprenylcysteine O-methyltransferase Ste14